MPRIFARIGTRLDQVGDVIYVTRPAIEKIHDAPHGEQIQEAIQKAVDAFLDGGQKYEVTMAIGTTTMFLEGQRQLRAMRELPFYR